jgi:hypothetical protein
MSKTEAREAAALKLRVQARKNGHYSDQDAWDACAGLFAAITRADVNAVKRIARRELVANDQHEIREV